MTLQGGSFFLDYGLTDGSHVNMGDLPLSMWFSSNTHNVILAKLQARMGVLKPTVLCMDGDYGTPHLWCTVLCQNPQMHTLILGEDTSTLGFLYALTRECTYGHGDNVAPNLSSLSIFASSYTFEKEEIDDVLDLLHTLVERRNGNNVATKTRTSPIELLTFANPSPHEDGNPVFVALKENPMFARLKVLVPVIQIVREADFPSQACRYA
ncbi:hypothetical protein PUNSTDRAFT_131770 [Punctularia strigosozonata HHB-11173 SS5]|uniref:uncharacterized protein n=1 Tax=Punctularia strigosozonata (strain HHB-11173) TaxID=741275 RepID=UPI0004417114|nr:uncharacterized protein PUNSTDRAFT_131770 [Punctularia strigosozonata HHB-11173 SS5]EIN11613.1 hypothetical protein PUNSTDRAFT_131770 [Punctularia strigosozonata HHB-11173 SS5]